MTPETAPDGARYPWPPRSLGRFGYSLMATGCLALGAPSVGATTGTDRGTDPLELRKTVQAAMAAERGGRAADARQGYLEAAKNAPLIRDWLMLRAAALTSDGTARLTLYAAIESPIARARITAIEAAVRERAGDLAGAMLRYDSLGRDIEVLRLRLALAGPAGRAAARRSLSDSLERATGPRALALAGLLARAFGPLESKDALLVARSFDAAGQRAQAIPHYARALAGGVGSAGDRLAYGRALLAAGRAREALAQLDKVAKPSALAAQAEYERARALVKLGRHDTARSTLARLLELYPVEGQLAADAALLAATLAEDAGDPAAARAMRLDVATRCSTCAGVPRARFLAALSAFERGDPAVAAREWEALQMADAGTDGAAAGYWAGVAWDRVGEPVRAREMWRQVIQRHSVSYYALSSAKRLGEEPGVLPSADDRFTYFPDLDSAATRVALLHRLSLEPERAWEEDGLIAAAGDEPDRLLSAADLLRVAERPSLAARLARRALNAGARPDTRVYRLLYPLPDRGTLDQAARRAAMEPALIAALVRQESTWEPRATSRAGARGLMQVMPATGALVARDLGLAAWHPDSLFVAAVNLQVGTRYLSDVLRRYGGDLTRALAAYNAGPTRVAHWTAGTPDADPELFVERIPFAETRDYVRVVLRNVAWYRALYALAG